MYVHSYVSMSRLFLLIEIFGSIYIIGSMNRLLLLIEIFGSINYIIGQNISECLKVRVFVHSSPCYIL